MLYTEYPWSFLQTQIPEAVIRTAQAAHEVAWQTSYFAQAAHEIAMQQTETLVALQRIPHIVTQQALSTYSAMVADLVRSVRASLAASGITAALETTQVLRDLPISQMQRLFSAWRPSYPSPPFPTYAPLASEPKRQARIRNPSRPRTRLIRRLAKQEFLQVSAASLVLVQATSPEILAALKDFSQTPACEKMLLLLGPSASLLAEHLSPGERKALLWIVWLFTALIVFSKQ